MAVSTANVKVGVTGKISVAPFGTALPTGTQAALNAAFQELGYSDETGLVQSMPTASTDIKAWQNGDIVRTIQTEHKLTFAFAAQETNPIVLAKYYGNYAAGVIEINGIPPTFFSWVFDVVDGVDVIRTVVPYAQITERGDVSYVNADVIKYPVVLTAFGDPNYAGALAGAAKAYEYRYDVSGGVSA